MQSNFVYFKKKKSFTIIEAIIAIFILVTGILTILSLISYFTSITSISTQKLIAAYLAQEGIEIVRNIRDGNLLKIQKGENINWDEGLLSGDWQVDYNDTSLSPYTDSSFLNLEPNGFYGYESGIPTNFKRKITLEKNDDVLKIIVEVSWKERGRLHSLNAQENIYNWQP